MLLIGIGQVLVFSCVQSFFVTAIPLLDFYDYGEQSYNVSNAPFSISFGLKHVQVREKFMMKS